MKNFALKGMKDADVPAMAVLGLVAASRVFELARLAVPLFSGALAERTLTVMTSEARIQRVQTKPTC